MKVLDISYWQPTKSINFKELATDVDYVFLRGQYGSTKIDSAYHSHAKELEKVGVPYGAYAYALFTSEQDARVEARDFIKRIKGSNPTTLVIDVEEPTVKDRSQTHYSCTMAFISECKKLMPNVPVGLYTGHSFYTEYKMSKVTNADFLWIPRYSGTSAKGKRPNMACDLWQYTDKGSVRGYRGGVDLNEVVTTRMKNMLTKKTGTAKPPVKPSKPSKPSVKPITSESKEQITIEDKKGYHVVKSGDTLGKIATSHGTTVANLTSINKIKNADLIEVGQKIYLKKKPILASKKSYITVKSGDTCGALALRYGTTIAQLKKWNKLDGSYTIYVGQKLRVK